MPHSIVAYDADCGPCSAFKAAVEFLDFRRKVTFTPLHLADEVGLLDAMDKPSRYRSFHLVSPSGEVRSGAEALLPLARLVLPGGRALESLGSVPGVEAALRFGYTTLSRLHDQGACGASLA